jgi:hypothetical protein
VCNFNRDLYQSLPSSFSVFLYLFLPMIYRAFSGSCNSWYLLYTCLCSGVFTYVSPSVWVPKVQLCNMKNKLGVSDIPVKRVVLEFEHKDFQKRTKNNNNSSNNNNYYY